MQSKRSLLFLLFLVAFCNNQVINYQKQLNLQSNELYLQNVSDFINEPAAEINWPKSDGVKQIFEPFQVHQTYKDAQPIKSLATLDQGESEKYIIGYAEQVTTSSTYQLSVVYQKLTFDSACQCLVQSNISQDLETVSSIPELFYGSFYNFKSGFISYTTGFAVKTYRFQINSDNKFQLDALLSLKLYHHVSILGPNGSIFVIQQDNQNYQLIKLDQSLKVIFKKETSAASCDIQTSIIDNGRYYFSYCSLSSESFLTGIWINFITETLSFQVFQKISQYSAFTYSYKRIGSEIMMALHSTQECTILKISSNESMTSSVFSLVEKFQFPLFVESKINFVSQNLLCIFNENTLQLFDIDKQYTVYQTQVADDGYIIQTIHCLGNQMVLYLFDNLKNYSSTLSAEVHLPAFAIQLTQSTQSPIQFTIITVSQSTISVNININIVEQNTILFMSDQITQQKTIQVLQNENIQLLSVEDQIIGSDLLLNVQIDSGYIQNAIFTKSINLQITNGVNSISQNCVGYQTDGFFSTIFICPSEQIFKVIAAQAFPIGQNFNNYQGEIKTYQSNIELSNTINVIDNQGSFTLKQTQTKQQIIIYLPYEDNFLLNFSMITIQCTDDNFQFASDPAYGILFTYCDGSITQYLYTNNQNPQIISKTVLISNTQLNKLICIDGILFAYSSQLISAYNYIEYGFMGQISVPTEGEDQQLTLFKKTFLITVINNPLTKIAQYSYNNFQSQSASFMRYLQIDSNHPINSQGKIVAKRSITTETAFILSQTSNKYYIYRINSQQWSNQLYDSISFNGQQTIITGLNVCQINPPLLTVILQQASLKYEISLNSNQYNQNFLWITQFTLSSQNTNQSKQISTFNQIKGKQQVLRKLQTNQIKYKLILYRDASAAYGVVNQNSAEISQLKTNIQDTQVDENQSEVVYKFKDYSVYNACITGWQNSQTTMIVPRINTTTPLIGNSVFTILYNQSVEIQKNQISSFFQIKGSFNECVVLDDKSSFQSPSNLNYQFYLYIICHSQVSQYQIQYQVDEKTNQIINSQVSDPQNFQFDSKLFLVSTFKQLITYNDQIYLFYVGEAKPSFLVLNSQSKKASIQVVTTSFYCKKSINFIWQQNLYLSIYSTGLIQYNLASQQTVQVAYLQDLLSNFDFILSNNDYVSIIEQYSDSQFRISFAKSFIFDITFKFDSSNQQLSIQNAYQYYYTDAFSQFISGFKGNSYTILFGYNQISQLQFALYQNSASTKYIYLIQSAYQYDPTEIYNLSPTYVKQINSNMIQVVISNGFAFSIKISDYLGVKVLFPDKTPLVNYGQIAPNLQKNPDNTITFTIPSSQNSKNKSFIQIQHFKFLNILVILLFVF